jgi:hypothetical protein
MAAGGERLKGDGRAEMCAFLRRNGRAKWAGQGLQPSLFLLTFDSKPVLVLGGAGLSNFGTFGNLGDFGNRHPITHLPNYSFIPSGYH